MADLNKVTNNLEILIDKARGEYFDFVDLTVDDAVELLALLKEQEVWHSTHGDIIAPAGTFEKIYNDGRDDDD